MKSKLVTYLSNLNPVKVILLSLVAIVFGIVYGYVVFPMILKFVMKTQLSLKPKTQMREMFTTVPFPLDFRIYVFNVTNPVEVQNGAKPRLSEIGPYYFEEWKIKYDTVDNDADDTLEYNYRNIFIFRQDLSAPGLTGNEIITVPHPLIVGISLTVNIERPEMLSYITELINELFHNPKSVFWTGTVMDLLFDGLPVDCSGESFTTAAACAEFESGEHKTIRMVNETFYKFALFTSLNDTDMGRFTVLRGSKNLKDLGRVLKYNDKTEQDVWSGDECNKYVGTDTTIFPPFLKKEEGYWGFEPQLCRSMAVVYDSPSKYAGIKTNKFTLDLGDIQNDEKLHCFCRAPDKCPIKGTFDLFPCTGVPLFATLPHFYLGHPSLLEKVESGLNPNVHDHGVYAHFYQFAGSPLSGAKRLQFNWELMPVPQIPLMKNMPEMLFPIVWIEEAVNINKTYTNQLKYQLILALRLNTTIKFLSIVGGILGVIGGCVLMYLNEKKEQDTTIQINVKEVEATKSANLNGRYIENS